MTATDLMFELAERAKVLANESIVSLRLHVAVVATTFYGAQAESKHLDRGQLIEQILEEEFADKARELDQLLPEVVR